MIPELSLFIKLVSHSHDFHRSSSVMAKNHKSPFLSATLGDYFQFPGHNDMSIDGRPCRATATIGKRHYYDVARPSYVIVPISRQNGLSRGLKSCGQASDIDDGRMCKPGPWRLAIDRHSMGACQHSDAGGCVVEVRWGLYIPWHPHPSIQIEGPLEIKFGSKNIKRNTKEFKDNLARKINTVCSRFNARFGSRKRRVMQESHSLRTIFPF